MSDKNKPQDDLSIEEILGSIRRIIAEDDEPESAALDNHQDAEDPPMVAHHDNEPEDEEPLELTNKIEPDGTIVDTAPVEYEAPTPVGAEPPEPETIDFVEEKPQPVEDQIQMTEAEPEEIILVEEPHDMALQDDDISPSETLLSNSAASATSAVMAKLARHTALLEEGQSNGVTVEGMVREILRPMLKSWLDDNLPGIVQKMVEREIERLTKHL